jgi:hypothetical protein
MQGIAHMACLTNPISQPRLEISLIGIPLITIEVTNSKRLLWQDRFFIGFYRFQSWMFCFRSTCITSGRQKIVDNFFRVMICTGFHELCLFARFVAKNFHLTFNLSFRPVHALTQFLLRIILLSSFWQSPVSGTYIALVMLTWIFLWLRLSHFKGLSRASVSPITWGRKYIQFSKRCVL